MSTSVLDAWLNSGLCTEINGKQLGPVEHPLLPQTALSIQKGQAEVFPLLGRDGRDWILKKFHIGRALDAHYLAAVTPLLPDHSGFAAGKNREILSSASVNKIPGTYHNDTLARWLDGTILMPRIAGIDWSSLADDLRDGAVQLDTPQRLALCKGLSELILLLEQAGLSHRDLSCGNVFIDLPGQLVSLIDFDSLYHADLAMPSGTTCGTVGYAPPYAWRDDLIDADRTWRPLADRYALTILNTEFLILDRDVPLYAEGGMFDQHQLRARVGHTLELARVRLGSDCPQILPLFEATIQSSAFDDCPSPQDWLDICNASAIKPPSLDELMPPEQDYFTRILSKRQIALPLWPAPQLDDVPAEDLALPADNNIADSIVKLPEDPWEPNT